MQIPTLHHVIMVIVAIGRIELENPSYFSALMIYNCYLPFPTLCTMWICLAIVLCTNSGKPEPDPELWIWKSYDILWVIMKADVDGRVVDNNVDLFKNDRRNSGGTIRQKETKRRQTES